ncbi:MAG: hypothetical protein IT236_00230, partial [Bacteroidia bacterium]|nr:hypothetical protein [Bacteroidia bacterium]
LALAIVACSGSRKYFKAAEKLEKQGLVNDAAGYYLESLQRKPTNVEARIKLKEVGQKHLSNLASEFFRNYNTQQLEATLETFEKLKEFNAKTTALDVQLDYPKTYDEDYQKAVENFCHKNYDKANLLVYQKKYSEALTYLTKIEKYNSSYKNAPQLSIIATCEPLYQSAINYLENKNYAQALTLLGSIKNKTENYKDSKDLLELATAQQTKSFILFTPSPSSENTDKDIEEILFNNFSQAALQKNDKLKIINNTPFQNTTGSATDLNNNANVDLIQAIRKATGADYFYVFDVNNKREYNSGLNKNAARAFQEVKTRKNDTLIITEYKPVDYNIVKSQRSFTYEFKYKIINAYTNQIEASQIQTLRSQDAVDYQEFQRTYNGNINTLFPYNPEQTAPAAQYNPRAWRNLFSARSTLKTMDELRNDVFNQSTNVFLNSTSAMR